MHHGREETKPIKDVHMDYGPSGWSSIMGDKTGWLLGTRGRVRSRHHRRRLAITVTDMRTTGWPAGDIIMVLFESAFDPNFNGQPRTHTRLDPAITQRPHQFITQSRTGNPRSNSVARPVKQLKEFINGTRRSQMCVCLRNS